MEKALVTGGAGFIGSHLVDALVARKCEVTVLDDLSSGKRSNLEAVEGRIRFMEGDICDRDVLQAAAAGCDTVFHMAAAVSVPWSVAHPTASARVNEMGTLNVLQAARDCGARRFVFSGSCAVYGDDETVPKQEAMLPTPQSPYAVQKLAGEHYAALYPRLYGLEAVNLRYFNVYGPRQDPSSPYSGVISIFMTRASQGRAAVIYGDGSQYRDFIFVQDVVAANLAAATRSGVSGRTLNVGTGHRVTIGRLWEMICALADLRIEPQYAEPRPGDILASVADVSSAARWLKFEPAFSLQQGLERTYRWYRQPAGKREP